VRAVVIIIGALLLLGWCASMGDNNTPDEPRDPRFACLSSWDGSHRGLTDHVRGRLRNPDSFEHVETRVGQIENGRQTVYMEYRAQNGFGGMNVEAAMGVIRHPSCSISEVELSG
jgi:hypothetical protein